MKAHQRLIKESKLSLSNTSPFRDEAIKRALCVPICRELARRVIMEYEWLGNFGMAMLYYGLYIDDVLVCVVCCGATGARKNKYTAFVGDKYANLGIQIVRGASTHLAPKHASSKLIGYVLRELSKKGFKYAVAFSDPLAGEIGTVYQASNWYYTGLSTDSKGKDRAHYNMIIDGRRYHLRTVVSVFGTSKRDVLINRGHTIEYEYLQAKGRYFYLLGSKNEKKDMLTHLEKYLKPYPKRTY